MASSMDSLSRSCTCTRQSMAQGFDSSMDTSTTAVDTAAPCYIGYKHLMPTCAFSVIRVSLSTLSSSLLEAAVSYADRSAAFTEDSCWTRATCRGVRKGACLNANVRLERRTHRRTSVNVLLPS
jgi:hypothetical protein